MKQPGKMYYNFYIHSYESMMGRKERSKSLSSEAHNLNIFFCLFPLWIPDELISAGTLLTGHTMLYKHAEPSVMSAASSLENLPCSVSLY